MNFSKFCRKTTAVILRIMVMTTMFVGCGAKSTNNKDGAPAATETSAAKEVTESPKESTQEPITLKLWTWFPSDKQWEETIKKYEELNPNIKIELTIMESKAYQEKVPIALATGEEIDIVGVQPTAMATQMKDYLANLDELLTAEKGDDWAKNYDTSALEACKKLTGGDLNFLSLVKCGAMVGYYNVDLFNELGLKVPTTIEEFKTMSDTIRAKKPDVIPVAFAAKEAWVSDEMMLTVMGQTSDYYNKWRYEDAKVDDVHFVNAMKDYKKYFDEGIFTKEIMDLDYGRSYEMFTTGKAATFFQGTWEAGMISEKIRKDNSLQIGDVGVFALPVVQKEGTPSLRAFLDAGMGVVEGSKHKKEAADFLHFAILGEGMNLLGKNFIGTPCKTDFVMDESLLTTPIAKESWSKITELVLNPTADRNNVSGYSDIEGGVVQNVILGGITAEEAAKSLQAEWTSGKYK